MYEFFANVTLIVHIAFILFIIFGGLLFFIIPKIIYFHFPALIWGLYVEFTNSICPLTYLENWFLHQENLKTYSNSFVQNYILPVIYPENLSHNSQIYLGLGLIIINLLIYGLIILKEKKVKDK